MKKLFDWLCANDVNNDMGFGCVAVFIRWFLISATITAIVFAIIKLSSL